MNSMPDPLAVPPSLASVQVSPPRTMGIAGAKDPFDRPWTTALFKEPVLGPVRLGTTNLAGDGHADLEHHGGPDKAVLAYAAGHYHAWRRAWNRPDVPFGAFGENFTIDGLEESTVCIGDLWQVGDAVKLQVSQPRQPCWKLDRRWRIKSLALQIQRTGQTGWYFRVVNEGYVETGMRLTLAERPCPEWTIERANRIMHSETIDRSQALELAAVDRLSASWRESLTRLAARGERSDERPRLVGDNE